MTTDEWILVLHLHLRPFDIIPVQQQYQRSDKGMLIFSKKNTKKIVLILRRNIKNLKSIFVSTHGKQKFT